MKDLKQDYRKKIMEIVDNIEEVWLLSLIFRTIKCITK